MFSAVQFLNPLILTLLCVQLCNLVKITDLPTVWERAAKIGLSSVISLFVKIPVHL